MIKKTWFTESGRGLYMLSIRQYPNDHEMIHNKNEFPPSEPIDGKRIGIDEAKVLNLVEKHHGIGLFDIDDLIQLRDAIDKVLNNEQ